MTDNKLVETVTLSESVFKERYNVQRHYLFNLKDDNLLQNYYLEAGMKSFYMKPANIHWGWESPECQLRGHYLGHWLSAAAKMIHQTNDLALKVKADHIVNELAACQRENGGKWVGSIPEKYLTWIARGRHVWAPQYTLHKTLMGLIDMYKYTNSNQALYVADQFSTWFDEWTASISKEEMNNILDVETGGLLETWADLLEITRDSKYERLIQKYYRGRLFDRLLNKEDCLTNQHANTTIPEVLGCARLYEVTHELKYKEIAMEYFKQAVDDRGYFSTGGQTNGESWTPPYELGSRLGNANQEHCVVYNMIRLADYLFKWTREKIYADYIERNIYNGLFAQQHRENGTALYYLSLLPNSKKDFGTLEEDFWCCYGTVAQAPTLYPELAFHSFEDEVIISQFIPAKLKGAQGDIKYEIEQYYQSHRPSLLNPETNDICLKISCEKALPLKLKVRIPWWTAAIKVKINEDIVGNEDYIKDGYLVFEREFLKDEITITYHKQITISTTPDMPYMTSFLYGPSVLAGLSDEMVLVKEPEELVEDLLRPINVNRWASPMFYTKKQHRSVRFIPLCDVIEEHYSVYYPVKEK